MIKVVRKDSQHVDSATVALIVQVDPRTSNTAQMPLLCCRSSVKPGAS